MKSFSRFFLVALAFLLANTGFVQLARADANSAFEVYSQSVENPIDAADQTGADVIPATNAQYSEFRVTHDGQLVPFKKGSLTQAEIERTSGWCTRSTVTQCNNDVCDCGCSCGRVSCSCYKY